MIEINLLPEEQRVKVKKTSATPSAPHGTFEPVHFVYLAAAAVGILLLAHAYLGFAAFTQHKSLDVMNKDWLGLAGQARSAEKFKSESMSSSQDAQIIEELTNKSVRWSEKLNRLLLDLPPGVWFNEILISRKSLDIKASVFSLESNGVDLVNKFLYNLKNDKAFYKDFSGVETGNMITKRLGSYEVMDFTLSGTLKSGK